MIPLASGSTSVGIVCDDDTHDFSTFITGGAIPLIADFVSIYRKDRQKSPTNPLRVAMCGHGRRSAEDSANGSLVAFDME